MSTLCMPKLKHADIDVCSPVPPYSEKVQNKPRALRIYGGKKDCLEKFVTLTQNKITILYKTRKYGNCDPLQLEAASRHASPYPL